MRYSINKTIGRTIKIKIFFYFLFKGVFLKQLRVTVQNQPNNSNIWWLFNSKYRVVIRLRKGLIISQWILKLDKEFYSENLLYYYDAFIRNEKRRIHSTIH